VDVDVDEAPQPPLVVVQVRLEAGVLARQIAQHLADGLALDIDRVLLIGVRPERGGNQDSRRHDEACPLRKSIDLLSATKRSRRAPSPMRPRRSRTQRSATHDRDRTATAVPGGPDANDRTPAALRPVRPRAAPQHDNRRAARESAAAALLPSYWAAARRRSPADCGRRAR